jgi:hypothetical protein
VPNAAHHKALRNTPLTRAGRNDMVEGPAPCVRHFLTKPTFLAGWPWSRRVGVVATAVDETKPKYIR